MRNGYDFFFDTPYGFVTFPVTPSEVNVEYGTNNKVVTLIDEGDVNILKSPTLTEVEFEARFPMRKYPYSREVQNIEWYTNIFEKLMLNKTPFTFIVARTTVGGKHTWDTNMKVSLEKMKVEESADEGDDVLITFSLKQYKEYSVKTVKLPHTPPKTTSTSNQNRSSNKAVNNEVYTVKSGDCLWNIAKSKLGNGSRWKEIYTLNKTIIENTANKYRNGKGSSNGHWIYPGTKLTIPAK